MNTLDINQINLVKFIQYNNRWIKLNQIYKKFDYLKRDIIFMNLNLIVMMKIIEEKYDTRFNEKYYRISNDYKINKPIKRIPKSICWVKF